MVTLQADTRDDMRDEDWEAALTAKDGHPIFALVAIFVLIGVAAAGTPAKLADGSLPATLGATLGVALLLWGIAFVVTIRHASIAWQLATFAIVALIGLLWAAGRVGVSTMEAKRDVSLLGEVTMDADGITTLPPNADRGPVSHILVGYFNETNVTKRAQADMMLGLGVRHIADPQALTRAPTLLKDCPRFSRAAAQSDINFARLRTLTRQVPEQLRKSDMAPVLRGKFLKDFTAGTMKGDPVVAQRAVLTRQLLTTAQDICTVLARRNWQAQGNTFMFTTRGDMTAYDRHITRWNVLVDKEQVMLVEARRLADQGQAALREALR